MRRVTELMRDQSAGSWSHWNSYIHPVITLHNITMWKFVYSVISMHGHRQLVTEILTIIKTYSHRAKEYSNVKISFDVKFAVYSLIFFSFCFRLIWIGPNTCTLSHTSRGFQRRPYCRVTSPSSVRVRCEPWLIPRNHVLWWLPRIFESVTKRHLKSVKWSHVSLASRMDSSVSANSLYKKS